MKISLKTRDITGKKVKNIRKGDSVPGAVFGPKTSSINVTVNDKEFKKLFEKVSYNKFFDVELEDGKKYKALVKDIHIEPVTDKILNVAFYVPDEERKITVEVPFEFIGMAPAEKTKVGFIVKQNETINVYCLPKDLPASLEVDLSVLENPGDAINLTDVKLPEGVEYDSSVGDPSAATVVYVATDQKEIITEEVPVEGGEAATEGEPTGDSKEESKE